MIQSEGLESLTTGELISACQTRGIRTMDVLPQRLRLDLQQWLDLHIMHEVPPSLLILSRVLMMTDRPAKDVTEALQTTLTSLPDEVVEETQLKLSEAGGKISYKKKLELIQKEEEKIADELAEVFALQETWLFSLGNWRSSDGFVARNGWIFPDRGSGFVYFSFMPQSELQTRQHEQLTNEQIRELGETLSSIGGDQARNDVEKHRSELQSLKQDREKLAALEVNLFFFWRHSPLSL